MNDNRISKFDNIKFWMILCVVIGHVLYNYRGDQLADAFYVFVYSFHMPVLIFIAGLFSKHTIENRRFEVVIQYFAIYLIMKFLESLADYICTGSFSFYFLWESGPAWFALAIAVFMLITMAIDRFDKRIMLILAVMVGCLAGLDTHFGNHFASMRICVFYPVFLAGYYMDPKDIAARKGVFAGGIKTRLLAIAALAVLFLACYMFSDKTAMILQLFKGKHAYDEMGIGMEIVPLRLICYAFWAAAGSLIFMAAGGRKTVLTWIGSRTMSIFIWHSFIISMLFSKLDLREMILQYLPHLFVPAALVIAFAITVVSAYLPGFRIADKLGTNGDGPKRCP